MRNGQFFDVHFMSLPEHSILPLIALVFISSSAEAEMPSIWTSTSSSFVGQKIEGIFSLLSKEKLLSYKRRLSFDGIICQ